MNLWPLFIAGVTVLAMPGAALAQGGGGDAAANWGAVAECGGIDDAARRHECVDDVLSRTGILSDERVAQAARADFGNPQRPATRGVTSTPEVAQAADASRSVPARAADIEELVTTVTAVSTTGYKRLLVTTAEGSIWEQTQAEDFRSDPKPGDAFTIQRGAIGGFRCQFRQASLYRCRRVE